MAISTTPGVSVDAGLSERWAHPTGTQPLDSLAASCCRVFLLYRLRMGRLRGRFSQNTDVVQSPSGGGWLASVVEATGGYEAHRLHCSHESHGGERRIRSRLLLIFTVPESHRGQMGLINWWKLAQRELQSVQYRTSSREPSGPIDEVG
jgi:hypothetical protein